MLQVYTGTGKGKTTAAIGLAIRALGAGLDVYIMQFMKSNAYSEQSILRNFAPHLELHRTGKPYFIAQKGTLSHEQVKAFGDVVIFPKGNPPADYCRIIADGFQQTVNATLSGKYRLVILDEINVALYFGLIKPEPVVDFINRVPKSCELVFTGRRAPQWLIDRAELVTEMKEVRHYYNQGVAARKGIEY